MKYAFGRRDRIRGKGAFRYFATSKEPVSALGTQFFPHLYLDELGNKAFHTAAQQENLLHQRRRNVGKLLVCHKEYRLDRWLEFPVHQGHSEFVFVIRHSPDPADDRSGSAPAGEFGCQPREAVYHDSAFSTSHGPDDLLDHPYPLLNGEHRLLVGIVEYCDDD